MFQINKLYKKFLKVFIYWVTNIFKTSHSLYNLWHISSNYEINYHIIEKTINHHFSLKFEYKNLSKVLRILKENQVEISNQILEINCLLEISVRKSNSLKIFELFQNFYQATPSALVNLSYMENGIVKDQIGFLKKYAKKSNGKSSSSLEIPAKQF